MDEKSPTPSDSDESSDKTDGHENPATDDVAADDDPLEQSIEGAEKNAKEALLRDTSATSSSDGEIFLIDFFVIKTELVTFQTFD